MKKFLFCYFLFIQFSAQAQFNLDIDHFNKCPNGWLACDGWVDFDFSDVIDNGDYTVYLYEGDFISGTYTVIDSMIFSANAGFGTFDSICSSAHFVLIKNTIGDSLYQSFAPLFFNATVQAIDSTLFNGTIHCSTSISGLTPPYEYSMDNGLSFQTSNIFTGLAPGPYPTNIFIGKSADGCLYQFGPPINYVQVIPPPNSCNLSINASSTGATNYQTADGIINWTLTTDLPALAHTITLQGPNGIVGVQNVAAGITSGSFTNVLPLITGSYSLWITNVNSCYNSTSINVDFPIFAINDFEHSCTPCDAFSTIRIYESPSQGPYIVKFYDVSGSVPVLAYSASGPGGIKYATGICSGEYEIIVNNSIGDSVVIPFNYDYSLVSVSITDLQNATPGNNDGEITVAASDGIGPFYYSFGETGPWQAITTFSNLAPGPYTIYALDSMNCSTETDSTITLILGSEGAEKNNFLVYPNPTQNAVHINFTGSFIYSVLDFKGCKLINGNGINEAILNLETLPAGIYVIEIKTASESHFTRIVVQ